MKPRILQIAAAIGTACSIPAGAAVIVPTAWKQSNAFSTLRLTSNLSNATGMNAEQTILFNHDGSPSGEPNTANSSQWVTTSKVAAGQTIAQQVSAGKVWVIFDLGAAYDLTTIRIWNFNWDNSAGTPLTSLNDRGISQFDVYVRDSAADTSDGTVGGSPINPTGVSDATNALSLAPVFDLGSSDPWSLAISDQSLGQAPNDDTYTGQSFDLTGNTGRFLAIKADSYYGSGGGVGLGKVRIEGTAAIPEPNVAALLGCVGTLGLLRRRRW